MNDPLQVFRKQGFEVFENILDKDELSLLQSCCDALLSEPVDDGGQGDIHKIGLGSSRRFLSHRHTDFPKLEAFLLGPKMAKIIQSLGIDEAMLFNEQFVVKGSGQGARFAWHQDGAYVGFEHRPYVTVWIALDDANLDNGCLYILPRNLENENYLEPHEWQDDSNELNGYSGTERGLPLICKAGTVVAFSSLTLHSSGTNNTRHPRRAYVTQYSDGPIIDPNTNAPKRFAKPLAEPA